MNITAIIALLETNPKVVFYMIRGSVGDIYDLEVGTSRESLSLINSDAAILYSRLMEFLEVEDVVEGKSWVT